MMILTLTQPIVTIDDMTGKNFGFPVGTDFELIVPFRTIYIENDEEGTAVPEDMFDENGNLTGNVFSDEGTMITPEMVVRSELRYAVRTMDHKYEFGCPREIFE